MNTQPESGDGVRITSREIYDQVVDLAGEVRRALDLIPINEAAHSKAHEVYDKRLENHGDRIRDLEALASARSAIPTQVATLAVEVSGIKTAQNRSAWVPALIAGLVPSILAALIIANLLPKV